MGSNQSLTDNSLAIKQIPDKYKYIRDLEAFRGNPLIFNADRANRERLLIVVDAICDGSGDFAWLRYIYDIMAGEYKWPKDTIYVALNFNNGCAAISRGYAQEMQKNETKNWLENQYEQFVLRSNINELSAVLDWLSTFHTTVSTNHTKDITVCNKNLFLDWVFHATRLKNLLQEPNQQLIRENTEDYKNGLPLRNIPIYLPFSLSIFINNTLAIYNAGLPLYFVNIKHFFPPENPISKLAKEITGNPNNTFAIFSTVYEFIVPGPAEGLITFHEGALTKDSDGECPFTSYFGSRRSLGLCYPPQYDDILNSSRVETVSFLASKVSGFADKIRANGYFAVYSRRGEVTAKYATFIRNMSHLSKIPRADLPVIVVIGSTRGEATENELMITGCKRLSQFEFNKVLFHSEEPLLLTGDLTAQHATAMGKLWISDGIPHKVRAFMKYVEHLSETTGIETTELGFLDAIRDLTPEIYDKFSLYLSRVRDKMPRAKFYQDRRDWLDFANNLRTYVSKFNEIPSRPGLYLGGFAMFSAFVNSQLCLAVLCIIIILIIVQVYRKQTESLIKYSSGIKTMT